LHKPITSNTLLILSGLFITLFSHATMSANILNITVKQKGSGIPVEGAMVVIDQGIAYDETSETGNIKFLDIPSPRQIKIIAPGYDSLIIPITQGQATFIIYLEPLIFSGESLEVTEDRLIEKTSKISLSAAELLKAAGTSGDPLLAITALPGVTSAEEGSAKVYMRGSNGNDNITWINNAPVGYLYHFGGFQSTVNPLLIEDINIFLGGFPVRYGDALGGVVDAKLRSPKNDRMYYQFDISTINGSFLVEGPVGKNGKNSFFVAGRRSYIDLILSPKKMSSLLSDDDDAPGDKVLLVPRFYDFQALYRHQLNDGYVDSYYFAAGDEFQFEIGKVSTKSDPQLAGQLSEKISYQAAGFTWQQRWNKQWDSLSTLAIAHDKSADRIGGDAQGNAFFANLEERALYFQTELYWRPYNRSLISFGTAGGYIKVPVELYAPIAGDDDDPGFDFTTQKKIRYKKTITAAEFSPHIKYRQQWTDSFTTQFGLRYTNMEVAGGFDSHQLSPRLTLEYKITPDTLLSGAWGRYLQMPEVEQIVKTLGNPSLVMTEAEHRILGVEHQFSSRYSLKAEVYQKPMKNLVISLDENKPPDNQVNRGTGEAYGFDVFFKRKPSHGKMGWLSFSWAKSSRTNKITGVTRDFIGDQPLTLTGVWGQPFGGEWKRWDWSLKAQVRSGRPYTEVVGRQREDADDPNSRWIAQFGKRNAKRLPTYYKVDFRIAREVLFNRFKAKFYLDMQNVTFANNIVAYDYGDEFEKIDNPTIIASLPFYPHIGIQMEF